MEEVVAAHLLAQRPGVVAQLTDLGRGLVHQGQAPARGAHRPRGEQRVTPGLQGGGELGIGEVQAVPVDQQVEPGRVPPADLEAVEGRQGDLHGEEGPYRGPSRVGAGEVGHRPGRAQAVAPERP